MSNVTLNIGGRSYRVACSDGQEAHLVDLGAMIDETVSASGGAAGRSEPQALLFAALMLADELHETRQALAGADALPDEGADVLGQIEQRVSAIAKRLEDFAQRLEELAGNA